MHDLNKFVEGYLTGVNVFKQEKKIILSLQEATGTRWALTASDVSEFMVLQMRMQNIIDRISIWDISSNDFDYRSKLFSLINGKFAEENDDLNAPVITQFVESIRRGDAVLIELEPVYGAIVLIFTRNFSFSKTV